MKESTAILFVPMLFFLLGCGSKTDIPSKAPMSLGHFMLDDGEEQPTIGRELPQMILLADLAFVGRIASLQDSVQPEIEVLDVLYGSTPSHYLRPCVSSWMDKQYFAEQATIGASNVFFAVTNDWWNAIATAKTPEDKSDNVRKLFDWEVVANLPMDGAIFHDFVLLPGSADIVSLDGEDADEVVLFLTEILRHAKVEKNKKLWFDYIFKVSTNAPTCLMENIHGYCIRRDPRPQMKNFLIDMFSEYIDYDRLYKGWLDDEPGEKDVGNDNGED